MTAGSSLQAIRTRWSRRLRKPIQDDRRRRKRRRHFHAMARRRSRLSSKPSTPEFAADPRSPGSSPARSIRPGTCRSLSRFADQLAHPELAGLGLPNETPAHITYDEGAAIGYKWYDVKGYRPLFAFGHGLSYTSFALSGLTAQPDGASDQGQFRDPQCRQAPGQRRRAGLCCSRRLEKGRLGSPQAARRIHQSRSQAGAEQDCRR